MILSQPPNPGGGNIQQGYPKKKNRTASRMLKSFFRRVVNGLGRYFLQHIILDGFPVVSGTIHDDKMAEGKKPLKLFPGMNFQKGIQPQNKEQLRARRCSIIKMSDGADGVGFTFLPSFYIGDLEKRVSRDGQANHTQPMGKRNQIPGFFMRRQGCGNEEDLV